MHKPAVIACAVVLLFAAGASVLAVAQAPDGAPLSPSQSAFLSAENRRIEEYFIERVAHIVTMDPARVRAAMPGERRITVAVARLVVALERDLGRPLSEAQKAAIHAADEERRAALVRVREGAWQR